MSIFQRAVTFAAISFGIVALAGTSAPGWAFEHPRAINAAPAATVPASPVSGTPETLNTPPASADTTLPAHELPAKATLADAAAVPTPAAAVLTYASLSDAVDAQDAPAAVSEELTCLAGAIYFESKGEPLAGQLAVAEVILNRSKSGRFPPGVCQVVKQRGQFSFVRGGEIPAIGDNSYYRTALAVAQVALADAWDSPADDALFFHARRASRPARATRVASIGNHIFYR